MTELEAFSILDDWTYGHQINDDIKEIDEAMKIIHKLVLRAIPKKAIGGCCPVCRCSVSHLDTGSLDGVAWDYICPGCGQKNFERDLIKNETLKDWPETLEEGLKKFDDTIKVLRSSN